MLMHFHKVPGRAPSTRMFIPHTVLGRAPSTGMFTPHNVLGRASSTGMFIPHKVQGRAPSTRMTSQSSGQRRYMPLQSAPNQTFFMLVLGATPVERM